MQTQIARIEGADSASPRMRLGAPRFERQDETLRPTLAREREIGLLVEMAHDLRSPLTSIISLTELLQSGQSGPVTEMQKRQLGLIYSAALCLCAAASDVTEMAREGERLAEQEPVALSLSAIFANLQDLVRPMVEIRGVELQFESPDPDVRLGFPRALNRVLLNLTTNAIKHTERGQVRIIVRPTDGDRVEFTVSDTGSGIDPTELEHLFEPSYTLLSSEHHFSSSGLGLLICRRLLAAMGSELRVETSTAGTRFWFEIDLPEAKRDVARSEI